jgi:hypothetical protein
MICAMQVNLERALLLKKKKLLSRKQTTCLGGHHFASLTIPLLTWFLIRTDT